MNFENNQLGIDPATIKIKGFENNRNDGKEDSIGYELMRSNQEKLKSLRAMIDKEAAIMDQLGKELIAEMNAPEPDQKKIETLKSRMRETGMVIADMRKDAETREKSISNFLEAHLELSDRLREFDENEAEEQ